MVITLDTFHFEMSPLNDSAPENMKLMSVTLDTSHFEMSPLNNCAPKNTPFMSVTLDTSHPAIDSCGQPEQSPFGESLRYESTAPLSSVLDCGENAEVIVRAVYDIEPDEPANKTVFLAFEWTQVSPQSFCWNNIAP